MYKDKLCKLTHKNRFQTSFNQRMIKKLLLQGFKSKYYKHESYFIFNFVKKTSPQI